MRPITVDGNEAVARVAYRLSEVIAIYPITPSSPMAELSDEWAAQGLPNLLGSVPRVVEMQSEGGAAGALHGALQEGVLATTFTASQGLLLMIPDMYKMAGQLLPGVIHVAARAVATHALSIFGDHQDLYAVRPTGFGILVSESVQAAQDLAAIAHVAALKASLPFLHAMDGFRTSHEVQKIQPLSDRELKALFPFEALKAFRERALTPEAPVLRGSAQNPDHFFQNREASNPFYLRAPKVVAEVMEAFGRVTGRPYQPYQYLGHPEAERVVVVMGSGSLAVEEVLEYLLKRGERVGMVRVRLYRPFGLEAFLEALPKTARRIAVLDRGKEAGALGEPLFQDVAAALALGGRQALLVGGRYGLSSKEFTPAMALGVYEELARENPRHGFTVGIEDDVTGLSLPYPEVDFEDPGSVRAVFFALGSDGTVSANKNTIKIIGEETPLYAQGYFVYDSKKSGSRTVSHLRFGPRPLQKPYLIRKASFVGIHQWSFLERVPMLDVAEEGATLLLNAPYPKEEVWDRLPRPVQEAILEKGLKVYVINAYELARQVGLPGRINTIMQAAFFKLSGVLPEEEAKARIKRGIEKSYGKRGRSVLEKNFRAVDLGFERVEPLPIPGRVTSSQDLLPPMVGEAPPFVREVLGPIALGLGDKLPVSAFPPDGTFPTGTARYEKRGIAEYVPTWDEGVCVQCGKCVLVCPHSVIRAKVVPEEALQGAPEGFRHRKAMWRELSGAYTLAISPDDCTGCSLCVEVCPAKDKTNPSRKALNMAPRLLVREEMNRHWDFFLSLPETPRAPLKLHTVKDVQLLPPLFEFPGACAGCGETPYLKLLSQLFGDRLIVANATGCSSIYGGNLPTTPWAKNAEGRGPAWANSLFEDNAEFGLGMRLALDKKAEYARRLLPEFREVLGAELVERLLAQVGPEGVEERRKDVALLRERLSSLQDPRAQDLLAVAEALIPHTVWIVGGDGWAYDIGYGGLDHVLASGANVKVLVLDTEVYSNTGGQASKATGLGAVAKFAAGGKKTPKKDLAFMAMSYGHVYVAQVAMGANDAHTVRAFLEAEAHPGPALIVAYSHCIAHGIDMAKGMEHQKMAERSGYWPLFRYLPGQGLFLDSKPPTLPLREYLYAENRYRLVLQTHPEAAEALLEEAERAVRARWERLERMAAKEVTA
ncbi:pyruvate:ferredoxin (flavodoxin) oxidoreductase, homodimeric [Thermus oshimai JL-2]|uniref:Pyruvate:ferredoxin (Flavodoxin) oxidoreductase, homodimeric n=1 Tax=Thermus oshimai JL-2 TaxID=751945 RepID=K7QVH3_THEOS|nr:pyruvate:ferredoxin (flavodoxin) oxidoreductase [Thermus oshimai]AFV76546.1 pyruvate:ferredoxin (flavodoxin) oxidoreductase, homodimeric [Thermus oshimai JL-2]